MSNLRARESLERAQRLFLEKPAAARKPNAMATAVWRDGLSCEVAGPAGDKAVTDMPEPMGGSGRLQPRLAAARGHGFVRGDRHRHAGGTAGIELRSLEVNVQANRTRAASSASPTFRPLSAACACRSGSAPTASTPAKLRELAAWGESHSPVSCTLRERPPVAVEVVVV